MFAISSAARLRRSLTVRMPSRWYFFRVNVKSRLLKSEER